MNQENLVKREMEIKITGYQIIEKTVKKTGNSGRIYVPNEWVGKRVKIILLEPEIDKTDSSSGESNI
jgi:putative transposon-encoded protein